MSISFEQFRKNLLVYGTDVDGWPDRVRLLGREILKRSAEAREILAEEKRFEHVLRQRKVEDPSADFAERILRAASRETGDARLHVRSFFAAHLTAHLTALIAELGLRKPARMAVCLSVGVALVTGFSVGFLDSRHSSSNESFQIESFQMDLQEQFYDEGEAL